MSTEQHDPSNPEAYSMPWPENLEQGATSSPYLVISDWLRANGLNPAHLPSDPHASLADGKLTLQRKVRGPNGGDLLTPDRSEVMKETITVDITIPPPPIVEIWLAPKCPTCGR